MKTKEDIRVSQPSKIPSALLNHAQALLGGWLQQAQAEGWLRFDQGDGGVVWPEEVQRLMDGYSRTIIGDAVQVDDAQTPEACWRVLQGALEDALTSGEDPLAERWHGLITRLQLGRIEVQALALLIALNMDQPLARAWRYAWANAAQFAPSWGFLTRVLSRDGASRLALAPPRSALFKHGLINRHQEHAAIPLSEQLLSLAPEVLDVLMGWRIEQDELCPFDQLRAPPARLSESLRPRLRKLARGPRVTRAAVHGPRGSGRLTVIAQVAQGLGVREGLWMLDLGRAVTRNRGKEALEEALRMSALLDVAVVVNGLERLGEHEQQQVEAVQGAFSQSAAPVIWMLTSPPLNYFDLTPDAIISIGYPSRPERLGVWREALGSAQLEDATLSQLAGQYLLSEGQIEGVAARALAQHGDRTLEDALIEDARQASMLGLGRLATPETARVSLDQLIVDTETETALEEIISYTSNRHRLMTEWGFADKFSYGLGVTCLFAGPPGTGKTFGAQAIATALGLELYRVDISQLVSKYIGETEKHLAELFDVAEKGEVLLLFDEADSLFGKRTEVRTSVDRYANLEVNYLLQRIERFEGVTILTTNFEAGLDEAFARRISFKVPFEVPDREGRERIWRALTPDRVPLSDSVEFDVLAEHFELSGGHIKEVLLRAASVAMNREEQLLTQDILLRSANVEYKKIGKLPVSIDML